MSKASDELAEAKAQLDKLIRKARTQFYKPIAIAEILYRARTKELTDLTILDSYRRKSDLWCHEVYAKLIGKPKSPSNSRYWDQQFDKIKPSMLVSLAKENQKLAGMVETYIYAHLVGRSEAIQSMQDSLAKITPNQFSLKTLLAMFETDERFIKSVDKIYEIIVYALFNAVTARLNATVTLSIDASEAAALSDFEDFAKLVLGLDRVNTAVSQPARLYRVGTANAADAGLDMWANFGPAVQVKHLTLQPKDVQNICDYTRAEKLIIVCKEMEAASIESVLLQVGLKERIRGIVTEQMLIKWYDLACGEKHAASLGSILLRSLHDEFKLEFPVTSNTRITTFFVERGYDILKLTGIWRNVN